MTQRSQLSERLFVALDAGIATVTLDGPPANALDEPTVLALTDQIRRLKSDDSVDAVVLTGHGKFFSFGFDVPSLMPYSRSDFSRFLSRFTTLYTAMFRFPKPLVAALNGHTVAGAYMLALACDRRLIAAGPAKVTLNEVTFGSTVPAGSVELLTFLVGETIASDVLLSGAKFTPPEALRLGLVDAVVAPDRLSAAAGRSAAEMASVDRPAFASIKRLLRGPTAQRMEQRDAEAQAEFVDLWYSDSTWQRLQSFRIHG